MAPVIGTDALGRKTYTFNYTGAAETWTVPDGVKKIKIEAWGAQGPSVLAGATAGGKGGYAVGEYVPTAGQVLAIYVGGMLTGFNGGGGKRPGTSSNTNGGGASDVRMGGSALSDRIIVAGGGGGGYGHAETWGKGGDGGGLSGADGAFNYIKATGGTQATGGQRGSNANGTDQEGLPGTLGVGGASGTQGGGGGGGYYGGGGGNVGGGGGGSSYLGTLTNASTTPGQRTGDGLIVITLFNASPTITLTQPTENQTLTEGSTYTLAGTVSDADAGQALSVKYSIGGGPTQSITLGTSDGITATTFSKTLMYSQGRFWDGQTDVSGLLPAESSSIQIWANDGSDDSAKVTRSFTIQQEDARLYVPVNVVNQAYLVSQMAQPVRLSNGWLVGSFGNGSGALYLYVSKDSGKTWTQLCFMFTGTGTTISSAHALASTGTTLYVLAGMSSGVVVVWKIDAATQPNTNVIASFLQLDAHTAFNSIDACVTPDGTKLWWAASTKNSSYPNGFNIRAGSFSILPDGSLGTPNSVSQVTLGSSSTVNYKNPSISFNSSGNPVVVYDYTSDTSAYRIRSNVFNGTSWGAIVEVYDGGYPQSSPMSTRTPNGKMHLTWHGTDSSDTVNPYIRYSSSADGTTWLATPRKLVKGQNASITSDKNGKLIITYEDSGYIKRIESTNEFVSYSGPFVVGAGTKPATFYDQSFQTDFTVPPTFYQVSGAVKYYGVLNLNKKPVVTLTTLDNQTLTENTTLSVAGSVLDQDVDNAVTIKYRINGGTIRNIASGVSDGSTPLSFARDLRYSGKRMWDGAIDVAGVDLAENIDHTLAVWAEDDKGGKSAEVTRKFRVVWNRPPTISDSNRDLGIMEAPPSVNYTVSDPETNPFTVTEKINGQVIRTFAGVAGRQETITIPHELWIRLEPGVQHALTIEAADDQGMMSTRTYTLTRFVDKIIVSMDFATMKPETKDFFTTDVAANRLLLTPSWNLPPGATLLVEVCNNAYDATPAWEDATIVVKLNRAHLFSNTSKTASKWGINFRIRIEKGSATQPVYLKGIGGAFD